MKIKVLIAAVLAVAALPLAFAGVAQTATPEMPPKEGKAKPPTGIVSGTVYCADTNLPARNGEIILVPTSGENRGIPRTTATDLNGRFALGKVPEGRYYIAAMLPGYVDLLAQVSAARLVAMSPDDRKEFDAHVTTVVVSAGQPAEVSLRLERGTEIDGTVTYDDGSPAISLQIALKPVTQKPNGAESPEEAMFGFGSFDDRLCSTDDHGRFRVLGVPPGEYLVSVTVPTASADPSRTNGWAQFLASTPMGGLLVYVGGSLRASKAKTIKVTAGGASADADIIIPLSKLHSVQGDVVLKSTGQPPPIAVLQLVYSDTQEPARIAIAPNGHFDLPYVPEESYLLRAIAGPEAVPDMDFGDGEGAGEGFFMTGVRSGPSDSWKQAGAVEIPLLVRGDVEGITIAVPDPPPTKQTTPPQTPDQGATPAPSSK
jgi:hypothetical protein